MKGETAMTTHTDDSALMERLKEEYKRGYKAGITTGSMT